MMGEILDTYNSDVILLDRLQTLFVPVFHIDIAELLAKLSEKYVIVTAWPDTWKTAISAMINLTVPSPSVSAPRALPSGM